MLLNNHRIPLQVVEGEQSFIDRFSNEEIVFEHGETGDGSFSSLPFQVGYSIVLI